MNDLYQMRDVVVLSANPVHVGEVLENQASSRDAVLIKWRKGQEVNHALPGEICLLETWKWVHGELAPRQLELFEEIFTEKTASAC